jgi:tryptophan synthase alpha chain
MQRAHIAGLIIPDLPVEESTDWARQALHHRISLIPMIAPTTCDRRLDLLADTDAPFVYCVSITGTTGPRSEPGDEAVLFLERVKRRLSTPLAVGFGISSPQTIRRSHPHADGVVVGSRLIEAIRHGEDLYELVRRLKAATVGETKCSSS